MNLQKAANSTHKTKRIGRGQGSGMGKRLPKAARDKPHARATTKNAALRADNSHYKGVCQRSALLQNLKKPTP